MRRRQSDRGSHHGVMRKKSVNSSGVRVGSVNAPQETVQLGQFSDQMRVRVL